MGCSNYITFRAGGAANSPITQQRICDSLRQVSSHLDTNKKAEYESIIIIQYRSIIEFTSFHVEIKVGLELLIFLKLSLELLY